MEVCENMITRLHEFNMQGISNTMFALGGLGYVSVEIAIAYEFSEGTVMKPF